MTNSTGNSAFILHASMKIHSGKVLVYVRPLNRTNSDSTLKKAAHLSASLYQFWIQSSYC